MRRFLRDQSLSIFFLVIFLAALIGQAIAGHELFNQEQVAHGEQTTSLSSYVFSSHFGNALLENWQSEYLQFLLFMLATVWLVQRGSPESKPLEKQGPSRTARSGSAPMPTPTRRPGRRRAGSAPRSTPTRC
jgi:hypothetical protein